MDKMDKKAAQDEPAWRKPVLKKVARVDDLVRGGGGKLSIMGGDTGDDRKPPGGM